MCNCVDQSRGTVENSFRVDSKKDQHGGYCRRFMRFLATEFDTPIRTNEEFTHYRDIAFDPPTVLNGFRRQSINTGAATVGASFYPEFKPGRILKPSVPTGSTGK